VNDIHIMSKEATVKGGFLCFWGISRAAWILGLKCYLCDNRAPWLHKTRSHSFEDFYCYIYAKRRNYMEIPSIPAPAGGAYDTTLLSALGTILLVVIGFIVREYLRKERENREYRDRRETEDREYRDKREADEREFRERQIAIQLQHYKEVSASKDEFRANYESNTNERLDGFESAIKALSGDIQSILEKQQGQISSIDKRVFGIELKNPSKEGV